METVEKRTQALLVVEPNGADTGSGGVYAPGQVVLFEQFRLLRRTWWWVLLIALAITGAVAWYAYNELAVQYRAEVVALPPNKSGTPLDNILGGVASSLKDVGLSKLVGKAGAASGYDNTIFFTSRTLYDSLIARYDLFNVYGIATSDRELAYTTLAANIDVGIGTEGPITIGVYDESPKRAMVMANSVIDITNNLARRMNQRETQPITRYMVQYTDSVRRRQSDVSSRLRAFMGRSRLIDPESQGPAISSALSIAQSTLAAYRASVTIYTRTYGAEDPRTLQAVELLRQSEQALTRLGSGDGGGVRGPNLNDLPASTVEYLNLRQEYEVNLKLLAIIEPMVMQAQFDAVSRDIPVLNVLDAAQLPTKKARPRRSVIIVSAFVGSLIIAYFAIALVTFVGSFRRRFRLYDRTLTRGGQSARTPVPPAGS